MSDALLWVSLAHVPERGVTAVQRGDIWIVQAGDGSGRCARGSPSSSWVRQGVQGKGNSSWSSQQAPGAGRKVSSGRGRGGSNVCVTNLWDQRGQTVGQFSGRFARSRHAADTQAARARGGEGGGRGERGCAVVAKVRGTAGSRHTRLEVTGESDGASNDDGAAERRLKSRGRRAQDRPGASGQY